MNGLLLWRPMLDAFSSYYNGALFRDISVHDYAAYQPTDENWRVLQGYGALVAHTAADLPIVFEAPVTRIDRKGSVLRLMTAKGEVQARTVILAVPTTVISEDRLSFDPPLPDHAAAADALPLGHVDKCFLALAEPGALPVEMMVTGRTTTADTGSYTLQPFGRPMIEGFFGGDLAEALEAEPPGAFSAFAIDELAALFGSELRRALRPLAESRWGADPYIRGAYSHARPGHAGARAALRRPVEDRIFFAGEACSPHAFSTCHGAYETGVEAAEAVILRCSLLWESYRRSRLREPTAKRLRSPLHELRTSTLPRSGRINGLNAHLGAELHHPAGGDFEEFRGVRPVLQ